MESTKAPGSALSTTTKSDPVFKKREPKTCIRCRNHGVKSILKAHKEACKFRFCTCPLCHLLVKRQQISREAVALKRRIDRAESAGFKILEENQAIFPSEDPSMMKQENGNLITDCTAPCMESVTMGWPVNPRFSYQSVQQGVLQTFSNFPCTQFQYQPTSYPGIGVQHPYNQSGMAQLSPTSLGSNNFFSNDMSFMPPQQRGYYDSSITLTNPFQVPTSHSALRSAFKDHSSFQSMTNCGQGQSYLTVNSIPPSGFTELRPVNKTYAYPSSTYFNEESSQSVMINTCIPKAIASESCNIPLQPPAKRIKTEISDCSDDSILSIDLNNTPHSSNATRDI